ncbi:MAG: phosphotransferase family protein [Gemmatimonadaceae bacterium]
MPPVTIPALPATRQLVDGPPPTTAVADRDAWHVAESARLAAPVIRRQFGAGASVGVSELIRTGPRHVVSRVEVRTRRVVPLTVIVKRMLHDHDRGFTEWAALDLIGASRAAAIAPRILGGDADCGVLVLEDFGRALSVDDLLRTGTVAACSAALRSLATGYARLHSATVHLTERFDEIRAMLPHPPTEPERRTEARRLLAGTGKIGAWFAAVGVDVPEGLGECIGRVAHTYAEPAGFLVLTHGDPAPGNTHISPAGARILDFEYAACRHAYYDITAWNVLCPLPAAVVGAMRRDYRAALAGGNSAPRDDSVERRAWAAMTAFRALSMLTWIDPDILHSDQPWVDAWTRRAAVLSALERTREAATGVSGLSALALGTHTLGARLEALWPEITDKLPPFAVYSQANRR